MSRRVAGVDTRGGQMETSFVQGSCLATDLWNFYPEKMPPD